jgi:hypothetical protein
MAKSPSAIAIRVLIRKLLTAANLATVADVTTIFCFYGTTRTYGAGFDDGHPKTGNCRTVPPRALLIAQKLSKMAFPIRLGADNRHIAGNNRNVS